MMELHMGDRERLESLCVSFNLFIIIRYRAKEYCYNLFFLLGITHAKEYP